METAPSSASRMDPTASTPTTPPNEHAHDALDDWAVLDAMTFDSSLSFLGDADADEVPVKSVSPSLPQVASTCSPPLLPECDDDDVATAALLDDLLALDVDKGMDRDVGAEPAEESSPDVSTHTSPEPPPPTLTPPPAPQRTHKSTSSRARQKEEIEYLRTQVAELESELARLKQPTEVQSGSTVSSVWENIAQRQSAEKQRAEIENVKLRGLVEGQLRVARSLEKLLRKRVATEAAALFVERKRSRESPALDLEYAVHDINARLGHQLDEVEAVIRECGLATIGVDFDDVCATNDVNNAICMELKMVKVLPFALGDAADAVWDLLSANRITLPNGYYGATQRSKTVADLQFAVDLRVRRSKATIHVRGVATRRSTANKTHIAFETVGTTDGPLFAGQGISCRERGYTLIEEGPVTSVGPSTSAKVCLRLWPEVDVADSTGKDTPDVGLFVDLIVGSFNENVKTMLQSVENSLIEGQLGK